MNFAAFDADLQKKLTMNTIFPHRAYALLGHYLEHAGDGPTPDSFHDLCRRLRVCPADLREVLENELGTDPEDILRSYFGIGDKNY